MKLGMIETTSCSSSGHCESQPVLSMNCYSVNRRKRPSCSGPAAVTAANAFVFSSHGGDSDETSDHNLKCKISRNSKNRFDDSESEITTEDAAQQVSFLNPSLDELDAQSDAASDSEQEVAGLTQSQTQHTDSFWMKFMCFTFGLHLAHVFSFKCKVRLRVPCRNDFWRLANFCNHTMHNTVGMVSHKSYALLLKVESTLVSRTARLRRSGWGERSLIPSIYYRQFPRSIWTQDWKMQQQQQSKTARFRLGNSKLFSYFRTLKWNPIPVSVGVGFLVLLQYRKHLRNAAEESSEENRKNSFVKDWEITCYRMLPWKTVSRFWGWMNNVELPVWARGPFLNWYVRRFGCVIEEAEVSDLATYSNLGAFFRRGLKSGTRPIDEFSPIVSPCDGRILHFGKVDCGRIEQVKGVSYSLPAFLGPTTWEQKVPSEDAARMLFGDDQKGRIFSFPRRASTRHIDSESYCSQILKQGSGTSLFYCVIYLAPGDYHRFHSPVEWNVHFRRHIGGELLSVNPTVAGWIAGLFSLNERANYIGDWKHGFFAMTAVGATNVGSIRVYRDEDLQTNSSKVKKNTYVDKYFPSQLSYKKGEDFGEFNLGSTIVLLFEAPSGFDFNLLEAQRRVKMGEPLLRQD